MSNKDNPSGINRITPSDQPICAMALRAGGRRHSFEDGIGFVDPNHRTINLIGDPKAGLPVNFNDGECDRRGRFWTRTGAKDWCLDFDADKGTVRGRRPFI